MFVKAFVIATLSIGTIVCEPPVAPVYGVPLNNGGNFNGGGGYNGGGFNGDGGYNGGYNDDGYNGGNDGHNGQGVNQANGPVNGYGNGQDNNDHHGYGEPKAYEFGYQVKDDYTGTNYNRQEQSDGNQVTGSYRVALPDGRIQIVTYYADWKTGFHADVRYEGEAQYPEVYNTNNGYNNNANNNGYNNNNGGYDNTPSNQYGAPVNPIAVNNQYAGGNSDYNAPNSASSSVSIKDFSGPGTPYNTGNSGNNYEYDSYSNGYDNKQKPNTGYGAP